MARPRTGQTPPISFRPPKQLLTEFDATIEEGRSRSDVLIELMHERVTKKQREQEKLSRERALLLTTFEPSAADCTINPPFTEPGPGADQLTDGTPEQLAAWVEKTQARLIESTGFDLRVPPEEDDGPERPVSGEENNA